MVLVVSCKKDSKPGTPSIKTLAATEIEAFSASLNAKIDFAGVNYASVYYGFYWGTSEDQEGTYTMGEGVHHGKSDYSAVITGLTPETEYWFKAYIEIDDEPYSGEILNFTTVVSPVPKEAVDLGFEMTRGDGTKYKLYWAKSNLSEDGLCANPEDYGDYYAWGETETKSNYSWSTYKFGTSSSGPFSKYNSTDNNTVLETGPNGDDVASKKLGGKGRMPTDEEWTELRTKYTRTWKTNYNGTGINGRLVEAPNGNSIFLPAAGERDGTNLSYAGSHGYYWSSSLYTDPPGNAWYINFNSDNVIRYSSSRYNGFSVRPVWEE